MKDNNLILIGIGILVVILLFKYNPLESFSVFPDKTDSGAILPTQTTYTEGDVLGIKVNSGALGVPCAGINGWAIWIDGKKYQCQELHFRYYCGPGNSCPYDFDCDNPTSNPSPWTFDFGQPEIPLELTPGTHTVEGWGAGSSSTTYPCAAPTSGFSTYFRFNINVVPKPCLLQPNQLIAAQLFSSGDLVSQSTLKYPVAQWCSEHPPKVYEKNSRTFQDRYDLFNQLKNGEELIVPNGESWILFYVVDNNPDIPQVCDKTLYYDVEKKICTDLSGIIVACPTNYIFENGVCIAPTKEGIISLTMKNTGSFKLYNISLMQTGTTPSKLYTAFSNLNQFELEPNGQVVFYANLDVSGFNGTIPFQMMFNTKYYLNGNEYSITKFTEPLVLNFLNGGLV